MPLNPRHNNWIVSPRLKSTSPTNLLRGKLVLALLTDAALPSSVNGNVSSIMRNGSSVRDWRSKLIDSAPVTNSCRRWSLLKAMHKRLLTAGCGDQIPIHEDLLGEIGLGRRQGRLKVCGRLPLPAVEAGFDLMDEDSRLQPCSKVALRYHSRSAGFFT